MRKRIATILAGALAVFGLGFGAAAIAAGPTNKLCAKNNTRELTVFSGSCPAGHFPVQLAATDIAGAVAATPGDPASQGDAVKIVHKSVVVNADLQAQANAATPAGSITVTLTGLPTYKIGDPELYGSNVEANPLETTTLLVERIAPVAGSTERRFKVTPTGFTGAKSFTLDVWVLAVP